MSLAACWYNVDHHGYELLETIGGTDTKFNVAHGLCVAGWDLAPERLTEQNRSLRIDLLAK